MPAKLTGYEHWLKQQIIFAEDRGNAALAESYRKELAAYRRNPFTALVEGDETESFNEQVHLG